MRRSICTCNPSYTTVGETKTYNFIYTTAANLPKGTKLIFEVQSEGRSFDWEIPSTNLKLKKNVIYLTLPNGKIIEANEMQDMKSLIFSYEFKLPEDIEVSQVLTISIGSLKGDDKNGTRTQLYTQRKKNFNLLVDAKGKKESDSFHLDVKGEKLSKINIITPSIVARNKRFDVLVRFEDEYGNLTSNTEENTLIELSYEHLRENLNWKLFIPETGFITLPNLYFNEPGIYKIRLKNLKTNETFFSSPIKCFKETDISLYWGLLHGESQKYDAGDNIENCIRNFRDEKSLQFYGISSFESESETSNESWKKITENVSEFNEDERFSIFLGMQWMGEEKEEGLRQFVFAKDNKQLLRKKDLKNNALAKIYKSFTPKELLSIPSFTMGSKTVFDFKNFNEEYERVCEIYNSWGSSEKLSKQGNERPITGLVKETKEGSLLQALLNGNRFGFVAGGLDDRGVYSSFYDSAQVQYSAGLTGILSKKYSRDGLFDAIYKRSCYATTGEKIVLGFNIAEEPMGSELSTTKKPGLSFNRYISGYVLGTDKLKEIIIYRNAEILQKFTPNEDFFEFSFDDMSPIKDVLLTPDNNKAAFVFYYLKVIQQNGHLAWSSPIWIDQSEEAIKKAKKK